MDALLATRNCSHGCRANCCVIGPEAEASKCLTFRSSADCLRHPLTSNVKSAMPPPPRSLPVVLATSFVAVSACVVIALVLLQGTHQIWQHGELLLSRSRVVPRLITFQTDPVEFFLRCIFSTLLAAAFMSSAAILTFIAVHRVYARRIVSSTGTYIWPKFAVRACLIPALFFLAWLALRVTLPLVYA